MFPDPPNPLPVWFQIITCFFEKNSFCNLKTLYPWQYNYSGLNVKLLGGILSQESDIIKSDQCQLRL